jgi:peptidoglycan/xylan/chitin deacetylase (PgdA/CDA1 family)
MTASQLKEMADAGFEIGAHTLNHKDLTMLSLEDTKREISESRVYLQNLTGQPVLTFAYPYGKNNTNIKKWAKESGFRYSVVISGGGLDWEEDLSEIFRIYVFPEDKGFRFWKKIQPWYRAYFRWKRGQ